MKKFIFLVLLLCGCPSNGGGSRPAPEPVNEPSREMKQIVSEIEPIKDKELAGFYNDFADIIERDSKIIETTGQLRTANSRAGQLMFQETGMKGKHPGLAEKVDEALMKALGEKDTSLDRDRAVEIFEAISWALN